MLLCVNKNAFDLSRLNIHALMLAILQTQASFPQGNTIGTGEN